VRGTRAHIFVVLAFAGGIAFAIASCGDDVKPLVYCAGGNGGAGSGGHAGGSGAAGVDGGTGGGAGSGGGVGAVAGAAAGGAGGSIAGAAGSGHAGGGAAGTGAVAGGAGAGGKGGGGGGAAGRGGTGETGGGGGSGGTTPTPGYTGCSHVGGVYRISVTKQASAGTSGKCFDINLWSTMQAEPAGLTLPDGWSIMSAGMGPCSASAVSVSATSITGTVTWDPQIGFNLPPVVNVNLMLAFGANDAGVPATEALSAQFVDVRTSCP
jgi:hypothetical protein